METVFPAERSAYVDPATGAPVIQWTAGPHNNQHLYFTSPSVTGDDRWLVFISDRSGSPNLYALDRRVGTIRRLSRNDAGLLRSYVYPRGGLRGLNKASPCLDPHHNRLYYIRDDMFFGVCLDEPAFSEREICRIPAQWSGAFAHISPDGRTLCIPCTDPRAFVDGADTQWEQLRKVPDRIERETLTSRIYLIDTATGATRIAAEVPFWVTHVQFDPQGTNRILFNREGFAQGGDKPPRNRIWCLEPGGAYRSLSPEPPGEWRAHENWAPGGNHIIYHGGRNGHAFLAARTWDGRLVHETGLSGLEFWHATGTVDGQRLLVDRPDGFISIVDPVHTQHRVTDICRHDSSVENQDTHPHPITTPGGKSLIFTSNRAGQGHVYEAPIPPLRR